jgi:hypothetical protein
VSRVVITSVLLLAFAAQAASAVQATVCPMIARAGGVDRSGCEHCPPPPSEAALRSAVPECCVLHAVKVEPTVSEPAFTARPALAAALLPPRPVPAPLPLPSSAPEARPEHALAPPPPDRNLPLLS